MPSAVTLTESVEGDLLNIPGVVLKGVTIEPRITQQRTTKFWGVRGESRIAGKPGGRAIQIPVLIYDSDAFDTARKLSNYIDFDLNTTAVESNGTLQWISEANHSPFADCTFDGALLSPDGVMEDVGGALGGGYIAECLLFFRQLSDGEAAEESEE